MSQRNNATPAETAPTPIEARAADWSFAMDGNVRSDMPNAVRLDDKYELASGVNQRVWMLVNKGKVFVELLETTPQVHELVSYVLGEEYLLSSYTANIAKPGGTRMDLHTDQWWAPAPTRPERRPLPVGSMTRTRFDRDDAGTPAMIAAPAASNVLFMLDEFTTQNGGTCIVPRSHRAPRHPSVELDADVNVVSAEGPAGTALITDGRVWHGTGANCSDAARIALITTYCGPQFRPQENFVVGTRREVLRDASPWLKTLLGLKVWWAYGRTDHPTVEFIDPEAPILGELRAD